VFGANWDNDHGIVVNVQEGVAILHSVYPAHAAGISRLWFYAYFLHGAFDPSLYILPGGNRPRFDHGLGEMGNVLGNRDTGEDLAKIQGGCMFVPGDARACVGVCFGVATAYLGASTAENNDFLTAQREYNWDVAHDYNASNEIDFEHALVHVTAIACELVLSNIVSEGREDVLLRTKHADQECALAVHLDVVRVPFLTQDLCLRFDQRDRDLVYLYELHVVPEHVCVCAWNTISAAVHFKHGEEAGVRN